jgi:uncharacterized protein YmfQ (DUF2313 family)
MPAPTPLIATPDRHIRRKCEDYVSGLTNLLPQGLAWPRWPDTVLMQVVHGLACVWEFVDNRAADLLEIESDPRFTVELLPDWERNWGLPDPCYTAPQTVADRQRALVGRMTLLGGQSRQWYINFAKFLGYTITISEYRTFVVGIDRCGDSRVYGNVQAPIYNPSFVLGAIPVTDNLGLTPGPTALSAYPNYGLGPPENRYYWTVHVNATNLAWFRCASGQCGVDPHLRIGIPADLECILNRWKPAHTQIIYDLGGLTNPSNPLAGTP